MRKSTKIDFFAISKDGPDLEPIFRKLHALPINSPKRTTQPTDDWVRLVRGNIKGGGAGYFGDMMRISMAPPGFRANPEGDISPIIFNTDEGVAECSAFYYDFESRILFLQRNSKAVSINQFAHFLKEVGDFPEDLDVSPILRPINLGKVKTLSQIRKIHISANLIEVMPTIEDIDGHTRSVILSSSLAESSAIEIVLKSGRDKEGTLNQVVAIEILESWLKIHRDFSDEENEIVRKIQINGVDDTGDRVEFDMLKDKMSTRMDFDWVPNDEALWETRLQKIQQAWDLNHANLKRHLEDLKKEG